MNVAFSVRLPVDAQSVPLVRGLVRQALQYLGVVDSGVDAILLALSEACANVVQHAAELDEYEVDVAIDDHVCRLTVLDDGDGFVDWSYINHYVANDVVVLCAFDDPHDAVAARILADCYPGRTVELVDARDVFAFGGGIHCITQQQPVPRRPVTAEEGPR